jgi:hypothetical protein
MTNVGHVSRRVKSEPRMTPITGDVYSLGATLYTLLAAAPARTRRRAGGMTSGY